MCTSNGDNHNLKKIINQYSVKNLGAVTRRGLELTHQVSLCIDNSYGWMNPAWLNLKLQMLYCSGQAIPETVKVTGLKFLFSDLNIVCIPFGKQNPGGKAERHHGFMIFLFFMRYLYLELQTNVLNVDVDYPPPLI